MTFPQPKCISHYLTPSMTFDQSPMKTSVFFRKCSHPNDYVLYKLLILLVSNHLPSLQNVCLWQALNPVSVNCTLKVSVNISDCIHTTMPAKSSKTVPRQKPDGHFFAKSLRYNDHQQTNFDIFTFSLTQQTSARGSGK